MLTTVELLRSEMELIDPSNCSNIHVPQQQ